MKRRLFIPLFFLLAAGCSPRPDVSAPSPTFSKPACANPGVLQRAEADSKSEIHIYLPPCYDTETDRSYPALYLLPGFGRVNDDFYGAGANRVADDLILGGEIQPFLMVATGDAYPDLDARFVTEKIIPFVDEHYRTRAERKFRAAAGGSFGGAAAYHLAFKRYDLFSSAGIFGNGAALGEEESIRAWLAAIPAGKRPRVFLNVGESDTYMLERAKILLPLLDEAGIQHMEIFSPGSHAGDYWVSNFPVYFRWLAQDWR